MCNSLPQILGTPGLPQPVQPGLGLGREEELGTSGASVMAELSSTPGEKRSLGEQNNPGA